MLGKIEGRRRRGWQRMRCHHQLRGLEFEQAPGVGDGQGSLVAAVHGVIKSWTWLSHWSEVTCNPMDYSMSVSSVLHYLPESAQTHIHWVDDAAQPSYPLLPPSPFAFNFSQHQGLLQWVSSSHQVARLLELKLQHQSLQWIFRIDLLYNWPVWSPCRQGTLKGLLQHHNSKGSLL